MDSRGVVTPPYVGRPLRLEPFHGAPADPATRRRPGLAAALRPTVPGGRRPSRAVAGARPAPPRRRAGALPARVHRRRAHRPRPRRRARHLAPCLEPRGPGRAPARGDPPRAGRRAGRPDDRSSRSTRRRSCSCTGHPRTSAPWCAGSRPPRRPTTSSTATSSGTGSGRSATPQLLAALDDGLAGCQALIADGHHRYAAYLRMQRRATRAAPSTAAWRCWSTRRTPRSSSARSTGSSPESASTTWPPPPRSSASATTLVDRAAAVAGARPAHPGRHRRRRPGPRSSCTCPTDRAAVEQLHDDVVPALPRGPARIQHHHSVDATLDQLRKPAASRC